MTESDLREKYRKLLDDHDFDRLELELRTPNIFNILDISRTEIRHSNFLAWLLDPNETHGLGNLFLLKFIRTLAIYEKAGKLDVVDIGKLNFNDVEIRREWKYDSDNKTKKEGYIDLLIIFDTHVICIENKVDTQDHSNQLSRYRAIVNKTFQKHKIVYVYLTPTGEQPNEAEATDHYITYAYVDIIKQIDSVLKVHGNSLNSRVYQYISDYLSILKRELMKEDNVNNLAANIYKNHKKLFDFVLENKPDVLYSIFEEKIIESGWVVRSKNKGYARFLTEKLNSIIPKKGQGWTNNECLLFEIDFYTSKKNATFKTAISPCDTFIQEILCKAMESESIQKYKKPSGEKWFSYFHHRWQFNTENTEIDEVKVSKILDNEWSKITVFVNQVETELLKYKDELKEHL